MIAMLLAGGQGSRLGVLTAKKAKPALSFGGKYRIIDFPMSNCINSGVDTVGVLTQYLPLQLNQHIGIGIPWDLDRRSGGVTILAPHVKSDSGEWYSGTANAIYQNIPYINDYNPDYVLILGGDHIYKMDYSRMLEFHKRNNADVTIAVQEVSMDEASRLGIMNADGAERIYEFEEKPAQPKSNLASMGLYIFTWPVLREVLVEAERKFPDSDFGKHIIPMMLEDKRRLFAHRFNDYWKDVGTIESYWMANMDLIKTLPEFNLYEDFWKIYTDADHQPPLYTGPDSEVRTSLLSEGCEVLGKVYNSVIGPDVIIEEGAFVRDSIIMERCTIGRGAWLDRCIADNSCVIGGNTDIGRGDNIPNIEKPKVYDSGITVLGENTTVPDGVSVGKNCVIFGETLAADYPGGRLESGGSIIRGMEDVL
uniref:Glucose-1-phosphate adenylyltransferase n=1 Tax=uncultured bacterium contig00025 TaxID=1181514 RepID=A0A806KFM4_9BACT|nr:glucose-1-phosphate adenylyltransferase [uncultured bacterium contig00025]